MANGLELLAPYNEPPKNEAVEKFIAYLKNIKQAVADPNKTGGRGNWSYKLEGDTYQVKLLGQIRYVPKDKLAKLMDDLILAARDEKDTEFRAMIAEYPGSTLPVMEGATEGKGKGKKAVQTGQANGIDRSID
ncbi:hypothetical protein I7F13_04965 [Sinorhizobium meliloti]|uniref:hypothetical protein n=1 Tax=Sinorhizobium TaxID=28105 RepID=UPI0001E4EB30|nr:MULTISPECIES: hypothetical protein [Sinorhizobium]AEG09291.1 hypothetical protein SinmeB_5035 [Sinorhizobium meliloti BL225C]MDE3821782.1 hypothetical protein [Sinorhizobium meliloti]MDE4548775.1 hypothetical protein [Sinorhizobium meliloti]MDE4570573.1 hypothetical protein [Sinorhizobium meliloti]MQU78048.1 hypothetical protein [Sinorhizobium medicae]